MVDLAAWIAGGLAALYALHRVALWLERRGWLYYVNSREHLGGRGSLLVGVAAAVDPTVRHLIEAQRAYEVVEEEGIGDGMPPGGEEPECTPSGAHASE
jgi:hypothetical protein